MGVVIAQDTSAVTVSIAAGTSVSTALSPAGSLISGMDTGGALTGATFTLVHAVDHATYYPVYDLTGTTVSWAVAGARFIKFDPPLVGYKSLKVVGTVNEAAGRTITFVLVP